MSNLFKNKRVMVTGGAGFVGANLVRRICAEGTAPTILDDLSTGKLDNLRGLDGQYKLVHGSVTDRALVNDLVAAHDLIFHLAARNIIASTKNPYEDFETNIGGTLNVLLAAKQAHPDRVVYTSSVSIYGNPRYLPINEDDPTNLLTPYAVSKFSGESYCRAFHESYDVPVAVVRYSNVFGVGQDPTNPYCGVVSKFMQKASTGEAPVIHGDGEQTRDLTYVDDAIEATVLAGVSPKAEGEVFNIGTGIETNMNTLADRVLALFGLKMEPVHVDRRDIDNIRRRVVSIEKARRMLRWTPNITLAEGLRLTFEWFKETQRQVERGDDAAQVAS